MTGRDEVAELTANLGLLIDARDWDAAEALFCDQVDLDYTSLNGGEPQRLSPGEIVGAWKENLSRLESTHHLIANVVIAIEGDEGTVAANVTGTHVGDAAAGDRLWTVGGRYDLRVRREPDGWRIAALTLTVRWATGNQAIMAARSDA
jgi:3-phenylpropionate/cinnamic acid dioxygenase small subunit